MTLLFFRPPYSLHITSRKPVKVAQHLWLDLDRVKRVVIGRQGEGPAGVATSFCGSFSCWLFASPRCGGAKRQSKKQGAKTRALCRQAAGFPHTKRARATVERRSGDTKPAGRARSRQPTRASERSETKRSGERPRQGFEARRPWSPRRKRGGSQGARTPRARPLRGVHFIFFLSVLCGLAVLWRPLFTGGLFLNLIHWQQLPHEISCQKWRFSLIYQGFFVQNLTG